MENLKDTAPSTAQPAGGEDRPAVPSQGNFDAVVKYLGTWDKAFAGMKAMVWSVAGMSLLAVVAMSMLFLSHFRKANSQIYVLDQGRSLIALQSEGAQTRDQEARAHVTMFHMLFFNNAPNDESIRMNIDRALKLCDRSANTYYSDLNDRGFYNRLIQGNIVEQIVVNKVEVDLGVYPYKAHVYAMHYFIHENSMEAFEFESTCELINVERSESNTNGFLMEKFMVIKNERVAERSR